VYKLIQTSKYPSMPEGVEVRKFADMIAKHLKHNEITDITLLSGRYKKHKPFDGFDLLRANFPLSVESVKSKGKLIYMTLSHGEKIFYLLSTLGLSGGWTYKAPEPKEDYEIPRVLEFVGAKTLNDWRQKTLKHLNVGFHLKNGGTLYFFDMLSFGTLKATDSLTTLNKKLDELGADILDESTDYHSFQQQIKQSRNLEKPVGNVLVNQKNISGVGNYLRADALWMAKISPFRKVSDLEDSEIDRIFNSLKILVLGDYNIKEGRRLGFIKRNTKLPSDYKRDFWIYRESADIHGNSVAKEDLFEGSQKRFIFWCPAIQK
jgi:endonuclease-8